MFQQKRVSSGRTDAEAPRHRHRRDRGLWGPFLQQQYQSRRINDSSQRLEKPYARDAVAVPCITKRRNVFVVVFVEVIVVVVIVSLQPLARFAALSPAPCISIGRILHTIDKRHSAGPLSLRHWPPLPLDSAVATVVGASAGQGFLSAWRDSVVARRRQA
jgi:hypothetical protein